MQLFVIESNPTEPHTHRCGNLAHGEPRVWDCTQPRCYAAPFQLSCHHCQPTAPKRHSRAPAIRYARTTPRTTVEAPYELGVYLMSRHSRRRSMREEDAKVIVGDGKEYVAEHDRRQRALDRLRTETEYARRDRDALARHVIDVKAGLAEIEEKAARLAGEVDRLLAQQSALEAIVDGLHAERRAIHAELAKR